MRNVIVLESISVFSLKKMSLIFTLSWFWVIRPSILSLGFLSVVLLCFSFLLLSLVVVFPAKLLLLLAHVFAFHWVPVFLCRLLLGPYLATHDLHPDCFTHTPYMPVQRDMYRLAVKSLWKSPVLPSNSTLASAVNKFHTFQWKITYTERISRSAVSQINYCSSQ